MLAKFPGQTTTIKQPQRLICWARSAYRNITQGHIGGISERESQDAPVYAPRWPGFQWIIPDSDGQRAIKKPRFFRGFWTYLDNDEPSIGAPGGIRTPDQWLRKPLLYPAELRAHGERTGMSAIRWRRARAEGKYSEVGQSRPRNDGGAVAKPSSATEEGS